jgi:hypothetical protein
MARWRECLRTTTAVPTSALTLTTTTAICAPASLTVMPSTTLANHRRNAIPSVMPSMPHDTPYGECAFTGERTPKWP